MSFRTSPRRLRRSVAGFTLIAALGLSACGGGSGEEGGAAPRPTSLAITTSDAGEDRFATKAPASIKGGLVKIVFKNASKAPHEAQLIRLDGDHTVQEAIKAIDSEEARTPEWLHGAGGVGTIAPGQQGVTFTNLPAGRYAVIDVASGEGEGPPPVSRGALAEFEVTPGKPGELPAAGARIVAKDKGEHGNAGEGQDAEDHEHSFEVTGLKPGKNTVLFDNRSDELHHALLAPIIGDTTLEQVKEALASEEQPSGPPPVDFENTLTTAVLDGQTKEVTELALKPGRYALLCFISDRDGGKPHFAEGMLREVMVR